MLRYTACLILGILINCLFLEASFVERNKRDLSEVYREVTQKELTMVSEERFITINQLARQIYDEQIPGDIVECGIWRGGMSIYLAYAFPDRECWACDSFQGFEPLENCKYDPTGIVTEHHLPGIHHLNDILTVPESVVRKSFSDMGLNEINGIHFLPGWVNDTTKPSSCPIDKIAILRIDVDAYSATLVVLENLYDKVVPGGFVIFDDSGLPECIAAIYEFERKRGIDIVSNLHDPLGTHVGKFTYQHGLYFRKPKEL